MPTATDKEEMEVNTKEDMVVVCEAIVEHLVELVREVNTNIIAPRGQANLAEHVREALDRMTKLTIELTGMPEASFAMVPESVMKKKLDERKAREKVREEKAKEREKERAEKEKEEEKRKHAGATGPTGPTGGHPDAQRHQSRQHV